MHYRLFLLLLMVSLLVSACNLGASEPNTPEPIETNPSLSTQPEIQIISPSSGVQYKVNEQILVTVKATDSVGVTRVQLFANGIIVKTISSQTIEGEQEFNGVLDFTPRTEGDYTLRVLAFRNAIASEAAEITVTVGQAQVAITQRADVTSGPIIPNDGLCRVLINVNLNFRNEPTTTRDNVIMVLPGGTLALVVARLGDYSWWKINANNRTGWVSGGEQYTTAYGNCQSVPVENVVINTLTPTPTNTLVPPSKEPIIPTDTPAPLADLIVPSLVADGDEDVVTIPAGESEVLVEFTFTVKNQGGRPSGQFRAEMRVNNEVVDLGVIGSIAPASIITITHEVTFDTAGDYDIRVDIDTDNEVKEQIEVNNRADMTLTVVNG